MNVGLKFFPYVLLAAAFAYGGHMFVVSKLERDLSNLTAEIVQIRNHNLALQAAASTNIQTIEELDKAIDTQRRMTSELSTKLEAAEIVKNKASLIFKSHNLTKLARAKPGLIEPRANKQTKSVFESIEKLSEDTANEMVKEI